MSSLFSTRPAIAFVLGSLLAGCAELPQTSSTLDGPTFEEWLAEQPRSAGGAYLVEGDLFVTDLEVMRSFYDAEVTVGQQLAVSLRSDRRNIWSPTDRTRLTYCIASDDFTPDQLALLVAALDEASGGWESAADVDFIHVPSQDGSRCGPDNHAVMFDIRYYDCKLDPLVYGTCEQVCLEDDDTPGDCHTPGPDDLPPDEDPDDPRPRLSLPMPDCRDPNLPLDAPEEPECVPCTTGTHDSCSVDFWAAAFLPSYQRSGGSGEGRSLVIGSARLFDLTPAQIGLVMRHELGHTLGFLHEQVRSDVTADEDRDRCDEAAAHEALTPADLASVMMYGPFNKCPRYNGRDIADPLYYTEHDLNGVATVYPPTSQYDVVRPNLAESYAEGSAPGDYDGNGVTDVLVRAGKSGSLFLFGNDGSDSSPRDLPYTSYGYGYGGPASTVMSGKFHDPRFTDFAVWERASGRVLIDWGINGLGGWDDIHVVAGIGPSDQPASADYDGDGLTDLAFKTQGGLWRIDYSGSWGLGPCGSYPCYGMWDETFAGYGNATAIVAPADYDGDRRADLAVKDPYGYWNIDFSNDCLRPITGGHGNPPCFGAFNVYVAGYGDADAFPIPGDYDGDGHADLAIKTADGHFAIDFHEPGYPYFHGWNLWPHDGYGDATWIPVPGKYHAGNDVRIDMAQKRRQDGWTDLSVVIDLAPTGYGNVDQILRVRF